MLREKVEGGDRTSRKCRRGSREGDKGGSRRFLQERG